MLLKILPDATQIGHQLGREGVRSFERLEIGSLKIVEEVCDGFVIIGKG